MAAASLCAGQGTVTQKATVTVCMESDPRVLEGARLLTAAMFARIGVTIACYEPDACPVGIDAIQVRLSRDPTSVRNFSYGVLAAAQPYAETMHGDGSWTETRPATTSKSSFLLCCIPGRYDWRTGPRYLQVVAFWILRAERASRRESPRRESARAGKCSESI